MSFAFALAVVCHCMFSGECCSATRQLLNAVLHIGRAGARSGGKANARGSTGRNPHVWFYLDIRDASGKVTNWDLEGSSPNGLIRNGWQKGTVKAGVDVTVLESQRPGQRM